MLGVSRKKERTPPTTNKELEVLEPLRFIHSRTRTREATGGHFAAGLMEGMLAKPKKAKRARPLVTVREHPLICCMLTGRLRAGCNDGVCETLRLLFDTSGPATTIPIPLMESQPTTQGREYE